MSLLPPRKPRPPVDPARRDRIVQLYTVAHLTCEEIGAIEGITRSGVWRHLKAAGVQRTDGTWVNLVCAKCGDPIHRGRARARKAKQHFCSRDCYYGKRANPNYRYWRQGLRIARQVVRGFYPALTTKNIVHHHDGNNRNNRPANLAVFEDSAAHMRYHHDASTATPIWDGRLLA